MLGKLRRIGTWTRASTRLGFQKRQQFRSTIKGFNVRSKLCPISTGSINLNRTTVTDNRSGPSRRHAWTSPGSPSRHRILPLESMIHPNSVVIEHGSESAAQSIIHRKTVVIEFGSESAAQSVLPGHSRSSNNHFKLSKFRSHLFRVARAA